MEITINSAFDIAVQTVASLYASAPVKILVLIVGLLLCFAGCRLTRWASALYGVIAGVAVGTCATSLIPFGDSQAQSLMLSIFAMVIGGIVLGILCFRFCHLGVFLTCGFLGVLVGYVPATFVAELSEQGFWGILLVCGLLFGVTGVMFRKAAYLIVTGISGIPAGFALADLLGQSSVLISLVVGFVLTVLGMACQLFLLHRVERRAEKAAANAAEDKLQDTDPHLPVAAEQPKDDLDDIDKISSRVAEHIGMSGVYKTEPFMVSDDPETVEDRTMVIPQEEGAEESNASFPVEGTESMAIPQGESEEPNPLFPAEGTEPMVIPQEKQEEGNPTDTAIPVGLEEDDSQPTAENITENSARFAWSEEEPIGPQKRTEQHLSDLKEDPVEQAVTEEMSSEEIKTQAVIVEKAVAAETTEAPAEEEGEDQAAEKIAVVETERAEETAAPKTVVETEEAVSQTEKSKRPRFLFGRKKNRQESMAVESEDTGTQEDISGTEEHVLSESLQKTSEPEDTGIKQMPDIQKRQLDTSEDISVALAAAIAAASEDKTDSDVPTADTALTMALEESVEITEQPEKLYPKEATEAEASDSEETNKAEEPSSDTDTTLTAVLKLFTADEEEQEIQPEDQANTIVAAERTPNTDARLSEVLEQLMTDTEQPEEQTEEQTEEQPEEQAEEQPETQPETEEEPAAVQELATERIELSDQSMMTTPLPPEEPEEAEILRDQKAGGGVLSVVLVVAALVFAAVGIQYVEILLALCFAGYVLGRYRAAAFACAILCVRRSVDAVLLVMHQGSWMMIAMDVVSCLVFLMLTVAALRTYLCARHEDD